MPVVKPEPFRHSVEQNDSKLIITIPARRKWYVVLFGALWLIYATLILMAMLSMGLMVSLTLVAPGLLRAYLLQELTLQALLPYACIGGFLLPFIFIPIFGLTKGLHAFLWSLFGIQILEVDDRTLRVHFKLFNFTRPRDYDIDDISNIQVSPVDRYRPGRWKIFFTPIEENLGIIAFKRGKKTIRFGDDTGEAEARHIVEIIQKRLPKLRDEGLVREAEVAGSGTVISKIKIVETPMGLTITLPNRHRWGLILYMCFCVIVLIPVLIVFGRIAYVEATRGSLTGVGWIAFIAMFLAMLQALFELRWMLWGKEVVTITEDSLKLSIPAIPP